ncbi:TraI domain-containing protein [Erwinia oleae]|uniref:TraI domain-containing protein n=1 Tax=Erwinia oleae TaxID=796334 RepID=UPI001F2CE257|nr:TraI domain-containing protein [Erwinia oleae]
MPISSGSNNKLEESASSVAPVPEGYHAPVQAREQLALPHRVKWLQMLWDYSSLPKEMYQQYYLRPLERCVTLMQQFPATENGHHTCLGGMVDYLLETTAYAARLSKSHLLPIDAPPEEQATQSAAWNAVIVYAAMVQSLDGLSQIEIELESGKRWLPLTSSPEEHYRFRFRSVTDAHLAQSQGAMRAWKIIPDEALHWLNNWPQALNVLSLYLSGFRNESGVINAIVSEAIRISTGNVFEVQISTLSATSLPTALPEVVLSPAVSAPDVKSVSVPPAESSGPLTLVSALDNTLSSFRPPAGTAEEMPSQEEDVAGELLAVMGLVVSTTPDGEETTVITALPEPKDTTASGSSDLGEKFWQWLSDGCRSGRFLVNIPDARIHIIATWVFIRTPGIFHQFLQENNHPASDKSVLQNAFERLGRHRQDKGAMYTCHLYQDCEKKGRFSKLSGYLILASKLYERHNIPGENPLLVIKQQNNQGVMP